MKLSIVDTQTTDLKPIERESWMAALWRVARRAITKFAKWRRVRRDTKTLLMMDDRLLADIGLRRSDVEYLARYGRLPDHRSASHSR